MTEDKTPYTPQPANDALGWDLVVKEGEVWLITPRDMTNLGPKDAAFTKMAEVIAAADFEE